MRLSLAPGLALVLPLGLGLTACGAANEGVVATVTPVTSAQGVVAHGIVAHGIGGKARDSAVATDAALPQADVKVIRGPGAPPSAGGVRDACTAYADCIDEMPRFSNDGGGMVASSATIRSWEKTPDRLPQCAEAHELARAGTLCH